MTEMTHKFDNKNQFLETIFFKDTPLIDLRAPLEYQRGSFPSSISIPLMSNEERAKVGICYKQQGQETAIRLGHKLVSGKTRDQRMQKWINFIQRHEKGYLFCFRGGLRSQTVQQWLAAEGYDYPLIRGGYKLMRNFLLDTLETLSEQLDFVVIGGRTGTRKTDLINKFPNAVDLEGRANHRGSSFGRRIGGQPGIIDFENNIAIDLLKLNATYSTVLLEDEGVTIGSCSVPDPLRKQITTAPLFLVESSLDERVENILSDYVLGLSKEYLIDNPIEGWDNYKNAMLLSLDRIKKRLGGERHQRLYQIMNKAFKQQMKKEEPHLHREWISILLTEYYDPMYDFQLTKKQHRIKQRGSWQDIVNLMENSQGNTGSRD